MVDISKPHLLWAEVIGDNNNENNNNNYNKKYESELLFESAAIEEIFVAADKERLTRYRFSLWSIIQIQHLSQRYVIIVRLIQQKYFKKVVISVYIVGRIVPVLMSRIQTTLSKSQNMSLLS